MTRGWNTQESSSRTGKYFLPGRESVVTIPFSAELELWGGWWSEHWHWNLRGSSCDPDPEPSAYPGLDSRWITGLEGPASSLVSQSSWAVSQAKEGYLFGSQSVPVEMLPLQAWWQSPRGDWRVETEAHQGVSFRALPGWTPTPVLLPSEGAQGSRVFPGTERRQV